MIQLLFSYKNISLLLSVYNECVMVFMDLPGYFNCQKNNM